MLIKKQSDIKSSEITDEKIFRQRRKFLAEAGLAMAGLSLAACAPKKSGCSQCLFARSGWRSEHD